MNNKSVFCLFILVLCFQLRAQKTTVFNGKQYLVFPQVMNERDISRPSLDEKRISIKNIHFPPIIGNHADGEYLMYSGQYKLVNKRKIKGRTVYDTVFYVYGTFTLAGNKKEGNAFIYDSKDQKKVLARVPYKNDLIHGVWYLKVDILFYSHGWDNDYNDGYSNDYSRYGTKLLVLNHVDGMLEDSVIVYKLVRKDSLCTKVIHVRNGMKHGKFTVFNYKEGRKHPLINKTSGWYKENESDSLWTENYNGYKHVIQQKNYKDGVLTMERKNYKGTFYDWYLFGKDSVLKHFPDYKQQPVMPYISQYTDGEIKVIIYRKDDGYKKAFVMGNYASLNYYKEFENSRDTLIGKRFFRIEDYETYKGNKVTSLSLIDTCQKSQITGKFRFCLVKILEKETDKNGRWVVERKEYDHYKYLFPDSFTSQKVNTTINKHIKKTKYYYPAMDYTYENYEITGGKDQGSRIFYSVSGDHKNGRVIKYACIPAGNDTIYLIDTLILNGKSTYPDDYYFNHMFLYNLKSNYDAKENPISQCINDYLEVRPVKHTCLMLGKSVFSGMLSIQVHYSDKKNPVTANVYKNYNFIPFRMDKEINIHVYAKKDNLKAAGEEKLIMPADYNWCYIKNGHFSHDFESDDKNGSIAYELVYLDNRLSGELVAYKYIMNKDLMRKFDRAHSRDFKVWKLKHKRLLEAESVYITFEKGLKEGQLRVSDKDAHFVEALTFRKDRLDGTQYAGNDRMITYVCSFKNDTLEGLSRMMQVNGFPLYSGNMKMGKPDGVIKQYYHDKDTGGIFRQKWFFNDGFLVGDNILYGDSGELKQIINFSKEDSIFCSSYDNKGCTIISWRWNSGSPLAVASNIFMQILNMRKFKKGTYSYYYKSGGLFKQGVKKYDEPVGVWNFYREGKRIYKTIDFKDTLWRAESKDSLHTYGYVKAYYDDGKLMFTGYALDKRSQYSCESASDVPIEENKYLEFYDTSGKSVLKNGSGFITELQASGYKLKEGLLDSFRKEGLWVYYSKFGLPNAIGTYKNDKKTGRWLEGDLGGLNISDKVCYMSDDEFRNWIDMYGNDLELVETLYVDGRAISFNIINVVKK